MLEYAQRLILDQELIKEESYRIKKSLMTSEAFNNFFREMFNGKTLNRGWKKVNNINFDSFFDSYLERENCCGYKATQALILLQKHKALMKVTIKRTNMVEAFLINAKRCLMNHLFRLLLLALNFS